VTGFVESTRPFGWFLVALFATGSAMGQTAPDPAAPTLPLVTAALELVAPQGCGSEADLGASITRRSDRIRIDPGSERRLRIEIRTDGVLTRVTLSLTQSTGRRSTRSLKASSCDEALEAAALVAAVSLDPAASTALEPPPEEKPPPRGEPEPVPERKPPPAAPPAPVAERRARWTFGVVAFGEAHWAPAPVGMLGPGLVLHGSFDIVSVLAPTVRLGGSLAFWGRHVSDDDPGVVRFRLQSFTMEVCPVRLGLPSVGVLPCGYWMEGRLWAAGRQFPVTHEHDRPFRAYGGSLVAWYRPVFPFEIQATVRVGATHWRDGSYLSEPFQYIHRVGPVFRSLGLGAGVTFP
jgi:hypothetical protein